MDTLTLFEPRKVTPDIDVLTAYCPVPGLGLLPMNAFILHADEPVVIDAGVVALADGFFDQIRSLVDVGELHWLWLTHADPDHIGCLPQLLVEAPQMKVAITFLGAAKLGLANLVPPERIHLTAPGEALTVGDRTLVGVVPPTFDAPETLGLFDARTRTLFTADSFGALLSEPAESVAAIAPAALRDGLMTWATIDAPWLAFTDPAAIAASLARLRGLDPERILSAHLPPAPGLFDTLAAHLLACAPVRSPAAAAHGPVADAAREG
jgi:glyoxylase-like metal-dependent hydrolase (beta-lactamase superfamily II)